MGDLRLEVAFEMFCNGVLQFGSYWDHILGYWKASKERPDKFLFMTYEELQSDQARQVRRLAKFLVRGIDTRGCGVDHEAVQL